MSVSSPRKPLQPALSFRSDSPPPTTAGPQLSYPDILALSEDYALETASFIRTLVKSSQERIAAVQRHWNDSISSLDDRVKELNLGRFVDEFEADREKALRELVKNEVGMRPMGIVEQSARKRKRIAPLSPNHKGGTDDETDVLSASTTKKPRSNALGNAPRSTRKIANGNVPASVGRAGLASSTRGNASMANGIASPTSTRKPARLRLRPSTSQNRPSSAANVPNFVYRNPASNSVPPTPNINRGSASTAARASTSTTASSFKTISRKPRRGESIVVRSLNDSPLGEFVAAQGSDDMSDPGEEGSDEGDEEGDWDMMNHHEASKVEDNEGQQKRPGRSPSKNKLKGKGKAPASSTFPVTSSTSSGQRVPSSTSFSVPLPANAPSYEEMRLKWIEEMKEKLRSAGGLEGLGILGEKERKGLEGILGFL